MSSPASAAVRPLSREELEYARERSLENWLMSATTREEPKLKEPKLEEINPKKEASLRLEERGIPGSEWLMATKPMLEAAMRPNPGTPLKERIYACGILHTAGFQSELAVRLHKNKFYPVTANDIRLELIEVTKKTLANAGIELTKLLKDQIDWVICKSTVRRAFAQLEREGRAYRVVRSTGKRLSELTNEQKKGLHNGDILLFFPFRPFEPEPSLVSTECLPTFALASPKEPGGEPRVSTNLRPIFADLRLIKFDMTELTLEEVDGCVSLKAEIKGAAEDYRKATAVALAESQKRVSVGVQNALLIRSERSIERTSERVSESPSPKRPRRTLTHSPSKLPIDSELEHAKTEIAATIGDVMGQGLSDDDDDLLSKIAQVALQADLPVSIYCDFLRDTYASRSRTYKITGLPWFLAVANGTDLSFWLQTPKVRTRISALERENEKEQELRRPLAAEEKQSLAAQYQREIEAISYMPASDREVQNFGEKIKRQLALLCDSISRGTEISRWDLAHIAERV